MTWKIPAGTEPVAIIGFLKCIYIYHWNTIDYHWSDFLEPCKFILLRKPLCKRTNYMSNQWSFNKLPTAWANGLRSSSCYLTASGYLSEQATPGVFWKITVRLHTAGLRANAWLVNVGSSWSLGGNIVRNLHTRAPCCEWNGLWPLQFRKRVCLINGLSFSVSCLFAQQQVKVFHLFLAYLVSILWPSRPIYTMPL